MPLAPGGGFQEDCSCCLKMKQRGNPRGCWRHKETINGPCPSSALSGVESSNAISRDELGGILGINSDDRGINPPLTPSPLPSAFSDPPPLLPFQALRAPV